MGALEGLASVPASAGEAVSAEFFGRSTTLVEYSRPPDPFKDLPGDVELRERETDPEPVVRVVLRAPERTVEVLLDPVSLGAETPAEAREYAASVVLALVSERPSEQTGEDPDSLASNWLGDMREVAQVGTGSNPLIPLKELRARVRELYGPIAEAHASQGTPTGKELAFQVRDLVREMKRSGFELLDLVKEEVSVADAHRFNGLLETALEIQTAEHALQSLELPE